MNRLQKGTVVIGGALLLCLLAMHAFASWFWGNWDQDNTGQQRGFWKVFLEARLEVWLLYALGLAMVWLPFRHSRRRSSKRAEALRSAARWRW